MKDICMKILNDINVLLVINENTKSERDETPIFLSKEINILSWLKYYHAKTFSN